MAFHSLDQHPALELEASQVDLAIGKAVGGVGRIGQVFGAEHLEHQIFDILLDGVVGVFEPGHLHGADGQ